MKSERTYAYEPVHLPQLPPLYLGIHTALSEPTETFHNDLRGRYLRGEPCVVDAMQHLADLAGLGAQSHPEKGGGVSCPLIVTGCRSS